ncbi:MAG: hypothetical protein FWD76_04070 [Firmicutes bacterium]|nr:hypothetical protein [Bacillota bacterium]
MKKVILACVLLVALLGCCFVEIFYTRTVYQQILQVQEKINTEIDKDEKHIDTPLAKQWSKECYEYLQKHKDRLMLLGNHLIVLELEKSIIKQVTLIDINQHPDCKVETMIIRNTVKELQRAVLPMIHNLV